LRSALSEKSALITANSDATSEGGGVASHSHAGDAFVHYFRTVMSEGLTSIEDAVSRVSSNVAEFFRVADKGFVEEGRAADLVLLGKNDYSIREVLLGGKPLSENQLEGHTLRRLRY